MLLLIILVVKLILGVLLPNLDELFALCSKLENYPFKGLYDFFAVFFPDGTQAYFVFSNVLSCL
jgi:hypothetical protein